MDMLSECLKGRGRSFILAHVTFDHFHTLWIMNRPVDEV